MHAKLGHESQSKADHHGHADQRCVTQPVSGQTGVRSKLVFTDGVFTPGYLRSMCTCLPAVLLDL